MLISDKALKRDNINLNTATDTEQIFGCNWSMKATTSGHYVLLLLKLSEKTNAVSTAIVTSKGKKLSRR